MRISTPLRSICAGFGACACGGCLGAGADCFGAGACASANCTGSPACAICIGAGAWGCMRDKLVTTMTPAARIATAIIPAAGRRSEEWLKRVPIKARQSLGRQSGARAQRGGSESITTVGDACYHAKVIPARVP